MQAPKNDKTVPPHKHLKARLVSSHLMIALVGVVMTLVFIVPIYWLRVNTVVLAQQSIPVNRALADLETSLQKSSASLRAWVFLGDDKFRRIREQIWKENIVPALMNLYALCQERRAVINKKDLDQLSAVLSDLYVWQWRVEDVANTPGNFPIRRNMTTYLWPLAQRIVFFVTYSVNQQALASKARGEDPGLTAAFSDFGVQFILSLDWLSKYISIADITYLENSRLALAQAKKELLRISQKKSQLNKFQMDFYPALWSFFISYEREFEALRLYMRKWPRNIAVVWLDNYGVPSAERAEVILKTFSDKEEKLQQLTMRRVQQVMTLIPYILLGLVMLILILSYWIASKNAKRIVRPILSLVEATKSINFGSKIKRIPVEARDEVGLLTQYFNVMSDKLMSAEKKITQMLSRLTNLASTDSLTTLANRYEFEKYTKTALTQNQFDGTQFALLLLDIDYFKAVNDKYGHDVGDEVLKIISLRLRNNITRRDHIARLGGDEVVIIVNLIEDRKVAGHIAEKLIKVCSRIIKVQGLNLDITVSIGIACFPGDGKTLEKLYKHADKALYYAKKSGRNKYAYFKPSLYEQ